MCAFGAQSVASRDESSCEPDCPAGGKPGSAPDREPLLRHRRRCATPMRFESLERSFKTNRCQFCQLFTFTPPKILLERFRKCRRPVFNALRSKTGSPSQHAQRQRVLKALESSALAHSLSTEWS